MPLFKPIQAAHTSDVWKLEFSPRGDRFATASSDATSMVIEYPSGRIVGPAFVGAGGINDVAFTPNGRSEEHTSELQSLMRISYAVFCLNKKTTTIIHPLPR